MKAHYRISSEETGTIILNRRKIAKALRWWLRENRFPFEHDFFCGNNILSDKGYKEFN